MVKIIKKELPIDTRGYFCGESSLNKPVFRLSPIHKSIPIFLCKEEGFAKEFFNFLFDKTPIDFFYYSVSQRRHRSYTLDEYEKIIFKPYYMELHPNSRKIIKIFYGDIAELGCHPGKGLCMF